MKEYETVYILNPQLTDPQIGQLNAKLKGLIERHDGRLFYAKNLGKKNLAYSIKKQTKGIYYCVDYTAKGDCVKEMERALSLDENILRVLTVVRSNEVDVEKRMIEVEARGEGLSVEHQEKEEKPHAKEASAHPAEETQKEGT